MRRSLRPLVPLLTVVGLLLAASSPAFNGGARDGKVQAVEAGLLDVDRLQADAVADGMATGGHNGGATSTEVIPGVECTAGFAGPFPCENVDLLSQVPIPMLGSPTGSDVWGWTDPETGHEIAIPTTRYGMSYVDVTDPANPIVLGRTPLDDGGSDDVLWRDVKVHNDHAFLVSEHPTTNLIVFDLRTLRGVTEDQGELLPTYVYEDITDAHNIAINTETGVAYTVAGTECDGGMSLFDVNDAANVRFLGCVNDETLGVGEDEPEFGVVHDAQCLLYDGPDRRYAGHEICFLSNEGRGMFIVDVTDKSAPVILSHRIPETANYTHQGWVTDDHEWFVFGDELDELLGGQISTLTYWVKIHDLENPGDVHTYTHGTQAIDHNLYLDDGYIWEANYSAGLRVFDYSDEMFEAGEIDPVAYFDVDPGEDAPVFAGAWTSYPFFESGTIAVNTFDSGLFLLRANLPEQEVDEWSSDPIPADDTDPAPAPEPQPAPDEEPSGSALPATGGGLALLGLVLVGAGIGARRFLRKR